MPLWGRNDQSVTANSTTTKETSNGAPMGTWALVDRGRAQGLNGANSKFGNTSPGSRANVDVAMFNNTTPSAFVTGQAVGVFGVDAAETAVGSGGLVTGVLTYPGSGYTANAAGTLTVTNGGTSGVVNVQVNSTGKAIALKIQTAGSGYVTPPTVAIAAPVAQSFNANTSVTAGSGGGANSTIAITAAAVYTANDPVTYYTATGNTVLGGLANNARYFIQFANSTVVALSDSVGGARLTITAKGLTEAGHFLVGDTARGAVTVGGGRNRGIAHAGWNLRVEGTGGRAGRVQYETLVAMGSLGAQTAAYGTPATTADAADDSILPDS